MSDGNCSFCGKRHDEVFRLITSDGCKICSECVGRCANQIAVEYRKVSNDLQFRGPNDNGGRCMNSPPTSNRRWKIKPCMHCGSPAWTYGHRKTCSDCRTKQETAPDQIQKQIARTIASRAIKDGLLIRQRCEECARKGREQAGTSHAHHSDYSRPLDVIWLCPMHHVWLHRDEIRRARDASNPSEAA